MLHHVTVPASFSPATHSPYAIPARAHSIPSIIALSFLRSHTFIAMDPTRQLPDLRNPLLEADHAPQCTCRMRTREA